MLQLKTAIFLANNKLEIYYTIGNPDTLNEYVDTISINYIYKTNYTKYILFFYRYLIHCNLTTISTHLRSLNAALLIVAQFL